MYSTDYISKIMDKMPLGPYHKRLLAVAGAGFSFTSMEVFVIAFTLPIIVQQWGLDVAQAGFLGSASLLGMLFGSYMWGYISDRFGRKVSFELTIFFYSIFTFLSAFAPSYPVLYLCRLLTGIGLGGCLTADTGLLSENIPSKHRGRFLVLLDAFWPFGQIFATVLAALLLPDWRLLFIVSAFPALIIALLRRSVYETPYFLAKHGKFKELKEVLDRIMSDNKTPIKYEIPQKPRLEGGQKESYLQLFTSKYLKATIMIAIVWMMLNFGYYGLFIWLPSIFFQQGLSKMTVYAFIIFTALVQFPGYFSAAYLVERIGRKKTLFAYLLLSGLFALSFGAVRDEFSMLAMLSLMSFFCLGAWGTVYAYTPELFPTQARASGMGWADGTGKIAAIFSTPIAGLIMAQYSLFAALLVLGAALVIGAIAVLVLGRETKGEQFE